MRIVNEAIHDGVGVSGIVDDLMPTVHGKLGRDDGRASPISLLEDFEEVMPGAGVEWLQPPIVEDEQVGAAEVAKGARMTPIAARQRQFFEELGYAVVQH
jgi:hypothetical protein